MWQTQAVGVGSPSSVQMSSHPLANGQCFASRRGHVALTVDEGGGDGGRRRGSFGRLLLLLRLGVSRHGCSVGTATAAAASAAAAIVAVSGCGNAVG